MNLSPQDLTLYERKLTDPRWKRIAALIKSRDGHKCQGCGAFASEDVKLHVHHKKYTAAEPWMEPQKNLVTLCEYCHKDAHTKSIEGIGEVTLLARQLIKPADYREPPEIRAQTRMSLDRQIEWARSVYYGK